MLNRLQIETVFSCSCQSTQTQSKLFMNAHSSLAEVQVRTHKLHIPNNALEVIKITDRTRN